MDLKEVGCVMLHIIVFIVTFGFCCWMLGIIFVLHLYCIGTAGGGCEMNKIKQDILFQLKILLSSPPTRIHLDPYMYSIYGWLKVNSSLLRAQECHHYSCLRRSTDVSTMSTQFITIYKGDQKRSGQRLLLQQITSCKIAQIII